MARDRIAASSRGREPERRSEQGEADVACGGREGVSRRMGMERRRVCVCVCVCVWRGEKGGR